LLRVAAGPARRGLASLPAHDVLLRSGWIGENTWGGPAVPGGQVSRPSSRSPTPSSPSPGPAIPGGPGRRAW
jgi:hypothetical protein